MVLFLLEKDKELRLKINFPSKCFKKKLAETLTVHKLMNCTRNRAIGLLLTRGRFTRKLCLLFRSHSSCDQNETAVVQDSIHGHHSGGSEDWSKSFDTQEVDDEMFVHGRNTNLHSTKWSN